MVVLMLAYEPGLPATSHNVIYVLHSQTELPGQRPLLFDRFLNKGEKLLFGSEHSCWFSPGLKIKKLLD